MKRSHRFRPFVICSFLILVAALGYAARSAATQAPEPRLENESTTAALGRALRSRTARWLAGSERGAMLGASGGASFLAPAEFYARSRAVASAPAEARVAADSSTPPTPCATNAGCDSARDASVAAAEETASHDARNDRRIGPRFGLGALGVASSVVAVDAMSSGDAHENLSPVRWFLAAGHFDDTTDVRLGFRGPWAPPDGSSPQPWHPEPCYTTGSCRFDPAGSPPPGSDSPSDAGNSDQDPSDDTGSGGPNPAPVIATTTTPEPSTVLLLATGLGLIALVQRRRRRLAIEAR